MPCPGFDVACAKDVEGAVVGVVKDAVGGRAEEEDDDAGGGKAVSSFRNDNSTRRSH